jgi:hypothetical protein
MFQQPTLNAMRKPIVQERRTYNSNNSVVVRRRLEFVYDFWLHGIIDQPHLNHSYEG